MNITPNKKILVVCGPTASGKTALAVECAKALGSEVISADSMIIYDQLSIGTAKPTKNEMQGVLHHLVGHVSPQSSYSVSDFERDAMPIVQELHERGKIPVVCGGTGFYINSLLFSHQYGRVEANEELRRCYEQIAKEQGNDALFAILTEKDPESAQKLAKNDVKRVIRALEIFDTTGRKKSEQADDLTPRFDYTAVCIDYPREVLYDRINRRVDIMVNEGLFEEVQTLVQQGLNATHQCMQGIGYKEVLSYLEGTITKDEAIELIKKNTRNYAKRQITFFKRLNGIIYLSPESDLVKETLRWLQN